MNKHDDDFWGPALKMWGWVKRAAVHAPELIRRWCPVILLLVLVFALVNVARTMGRDMYISTELYTYVILGAGACIGLGASAAGGGE